MKTLKALVVVLMCVPGVAAGATITIGPTAVDTLPLVTLFPPALEVHPSDPDRAWIARAINQPSVLEVAITPAQTLDQ